MHVLSEYFGDRINITDVVSSISALMCLNMRKEPADVYLMEAFGQSENYNNWANFTNFIATYYPATTCLVWSSKPTMFLRRFNAFEGKNSCWQIPKRIGVDPFIFFLTRILDGKVTPFGTRNCIGPPMSNLTPSEIAIVTGIIEGRSIKWLAQKYNVAYKTICTHKRNAMIKMHISSTAQLRSLIIDGYILRGDKDRYLPVEISADQPFRL